MAYPTRALNVLGRDLSGNIQRKKFNYISPTATATEMYNAVTALYGLSSYGYVDAEIVNTLSLNEEKAKEEG